LDADTVAFSFKDTPKAREAAEAYQSNAAIGIKDFVDSYRSLRSLLFKIRKNRAEQKPPTAKAQAH
jgi:hypothetical protein